MDLNKLRARLSEIDDQIIDLVAERQSVVDQIGVVKRADGHATRDFVREKQVLDTARDRAARLGVPITLAESVMELLIRSSLANQEKARVRAEAQGKGRKALVIGGGGEMGRWFVEFLDSQGFDVVVADPQSRFDGFEKIEDWRQAPDAFAVTVIAAPISVTRKILEEIASVRRSGLIFDIGSLKSPLQDELRRLAAIGVKITSLHPMFGPDTQLLSGRHVLFMDVGAPEATKEARQLFSSTMAQQIEIKLEDHDRMIAYVLGLSHALNISFFTALANSGEILPQLANLSSTTFDAQLEVAAKVAKENPRLYFEIQSLNPHGLAPLKDLLKAVQEISDVVEQRDEEAFVELMERGRSYLEKRR